MRATEIRKTFLSFFKNKGHTIVPSSSLIPDDPSCLFTTAGMQQFKDYYLDKESSYGNRTASCQKCLRTSDLEEVGDETHLTFFEMLGNFAFKNSYFKKEAIAWATEYLEKELNLKSDQLWFTYFKGEGEVPEDKEAKEALLSLGIKEEKISGCLRKDNFWGPTGDQGPCGPTVEIHYQLWDEPCEKGKNCLPNCDCGRFLEIWNLVFNEFFQDKQGKLTPLKYKGVDTGMGLERLALLLQKKESVYQTDLFWPLIEEIQKISPSLFEKEKRICRILADHSKSITFLTSEGIEPSNLDRGYVVRRLIRRALRFARLVNLPGEVLIKLAEKTIEIYQDVYPELLSKKNEILTIIEKEKEKFSHTLEEGLKKFERLTKQKVEKGMRVLEGKEAFDLYQSYGFPLELTKEMAREKDLVVDEKGFFKALKIHQEISRAGAEKKFGGIGKTPNYKAIRLHTATHLLHAALRQVLGKEVKQMGSDITPERLRFDFSFSRKPTQEELQKIETLVNKKIEEGLEVKKEEMSYQEAVKSGALAFFKEKYPPRVSVYSVAGFSREICAGPHVKNTKEVGHFRIIKEESIGAGVRRIKAIVEP